MKLALKAAIATSTLACAVLLSFNWSEQYGVSLAVETAQANGRGYANRSYVTGRPTLTPRYYGGYGGYGAGDYYCRYGVGCGYGSLGDYYGSFAIPGFPASFYGEYGGYSDGYYGRYVNRRWRVPE
jgi:hypothetical protein